MLTGKQAKYFLEKELRVIITETPCGYSWNWQTKSEEALVFLAEERLSEKATAWHIPEAALRIQIVKSMDRKPEIRDKVEGGLEYALEDVYRKYHTESRNLTPDQLNRWDNIVDQVVELFEELMTNNE